MHKLFLSYYKPKKDVLAKMWKECIFVFDTSVLLNIYRYTPETREDFFRLLEKLKKRIWIPHQVALEYLEQRENVISQQQIIYNDINEIKTFFQKNILNKYKRGHPFANIEEIKQILDDAIEKAKDALREAQSKSPDLLEEDVHLDRIIQLFGDNVGNPFPKSTLHKVYEEAQQRYKEKVPPGYEDEKSKENPFGDIVLWYQLIEHAKSQKKPIIFVLDDTKGDWWRQHKDKKEEILGPRPELIEEIHNKANISFYMYLADEFIKLAPQFLDIQINPETIREVREVRQRAVDDDEIRSQQEYFRSLIRSLTTNEHTSTLSNLNRHLLDQGLLLDQDSDTEIMHDALRSLLLHKKLSPTQEIRIRKYLNIMLRIMKDRYQSAYDNDNLQTLSQLIDEDKRHEANKQSHNATNISNDELDAENHED